MINRIVDAALGSRTVVLMLIAALVAAGLLSMQRLPFDADPDISPLQVLVKASAPGRNGLCPCGSGRKFKRCHGAPDAVLH